MVASDQWTTMSNQAIESIRQMQTSVPQFGIQPHVVLPVFQAKEETQYVLAASGEQRGPFTLLQVKRLLAEKAINPNFYIWSQGWPEWRFIKDCPDLF